MREPEVIRAAIRAYRTLLWLYPAEFRVDYGPEMLRLFRDRCRDERWISGPWGLIRLWAETALDLVRTVPGAHAEAARRRYGSPLVPCWIAGCALTVSALLHLAMWGHIRATAWRPYHLARAEDLPSALPWSVAAALVVIAGGLALSIGNCRRLSERAGRKGGRMQTKALFLGLSLFVAAGSVEGEGASPKAKTWSEDALAATWKGNLAGVADVEITFARKAGRLTGKLAIDFLAAGGRDEYQLDGLVFDGAKLTFAMKRDAVKIRNGEIRLVSDTEAVLNTDEAAPNEEKNVRLSKQQ